MNNASRATFIAIASFLALDTLLPATTRAQGINPSAAAPALTLGQQSAVEALIAGWVSAHPEALRAALDPVAAAGIEDAGDGTLGNPKGDVAVVAFVDRGSAPSSAAMPVIIALVASDPRLRVTIKELPLVSRASVDAALIAYAARRQGDSAFRGFESAMLAAPGAADGASARKAAEKAGLDMAKLNADASAPEARDYLRRVRASATDLGINAAPTFLIGSRALVGARSLGELRAAVASARPQKASGG